MSTVRFDPLFSVAVRDELMFRVSQTRRRPHTRRWLLGGAALAIGAAAAAGGAAAGGLLTLPGDNVVTLVGTELVETHTGSTTIDLGQAPAGATGVYLQITCLSAGFVTFPDGADTGCDPVDVGTRRAASSYTLHDPSRSGVIELSSTPGMTWQVSARWVVETTTDLAVNSHGQTYGTVATGLSPDLVAVLATNGKEGYVFAKELAHADGSDQNFTSPAQAIAWSEAHQGVSTSIPVFESDGVTRIGNFVVGG